VLKHILLVCHASPKIGLGHLSRLLALAQALKKDGRIQPEFLIFGEYIQKDELADFNTTFLADSDDSIGKLKDSIQTHKPSMVVFDLYSKHDFTGFGELLMWLKEQNIRQIGVDSLVEYCDILDLVWIPSFNFDVSRYVNCKNTLKSGWDSFLIQKRLRHNDWTPGFKILILTGGSDVSNLGKTLPIQLDELLDKNTEVHWVRGPFSSEPNLPKKCRLKWMVHNAPEQLDELIVQSDYVITVFGVSFFEVLQYGIPTVVFSPYDNKDNNELDALSEEGVAMVVNNPKLAIEGLIELMNNPKLAKEYSINALKKMSINGTQSLSKEIYSIIRSK
jgi:spore coat polysaccharide biosynthesis predicted glycosyltransferase SpsG